MLYDATALDLEEVKASCFVSLSPLKLKTFPKKEKRKYLCLFPIMDVFEAKRTYTESEVNALLEAIYEDYCILRRYLVDYGFIKRTKDGKAYWVSEDALL